MISTHSAREDGDCTKNLRDYLLKISTHSAREDGDDSDHITIHGVEISTHSAREDGDFGWGGTSVISEDFNPLRPRGRRQKVSGREQETGQISTHSAREDGDTV